MHIVVCVKQIYDPEVATSIFKVDEEKKSVVSIPGLQLVMSPFDEQAVEAALRIREAASEEVKISVLTLGAPSARDILKHGLSMGADEAIFIDSTPLVGQDFTTTASVLASAIETCDDVKLVITGRQAADLDAGVIGSGLSERLGMPLVNWASSITVADGTATVERILDDGSETVSIGLPAVVSVSNELGEPRKPSLRETMRAARKPTRDLSLQDLGLADGGASLVRQTVERLYIPTKEGHCQFIEGATAQEMAANLVRELQSAKLL